MPSTHQITAWEAPINILFAEVFGKARNASEAMRIDNALSTRRWKLKIAPPIVMLGSASLRATTALRALVWQVDKAY